MGQFAASTKMRIWGSGAGRNRRSLPPRSISTLAKFKQSAASPAGSPRRSRTGRVAHELGFAIVSGRYKQHSLLPGDAQLTAQFGISRTVLREAVKTLTGKGLLQSKARVGTRVRDRTDWNLFDPDVLIWHTQGGLDRSFLQFLGEMRLALEPEAAALAARRRNAEQLAELYAHVQRMGAKGVTIGEFVAADVDLHLGVAAAAGNPFLKSISTLIEVALRSALLRSSPTDERTGVRRSAAKHKAIVDAIASRDADGARKAMRSVIEEGMRHSLSPAKRR